MRCAGGRGRSEHRSGANGAPLKIPVPCGTVVSRILPRRDADGKLRLEFLADLDKPGMELLLAEGTPPREG